MPTREEIAYFGAGPAPLTTETIKRSAEALVNFENQGIGLAEISHRSATATKVINDAKAALATLYDIPTDEYEIIFMQAGGTAEFSATVQNMVGYWVERRRRRAVADLGEGKDAEVVERVRKEIKEELKCDYLVTGGWSLKASQEAARLIGAQYVNVALDGRKYSKNGKMFTSIPNEKEWKLTPTRKNGGTGSAFVYYCDNETVDGVEFQKFPECLKAGDDDERIVVADMSSNFVSRKFNIRDYGLIYGGAQKNLGITGITVTIIRKSLLALTPSPTFLQQVSDVLPSAIPPIMFDYATLVKNNSLYNTLPIFNLYVATIVLQNLVALFPDNKVAGQEEIANKKAKMLYDALDKHDDVYHVVPDKGIRSRMNVCFRIKPKKSNGGEGEQWDEAREKEFIAGAEKRGLTGIKGHRSVGGMRASNYNAVSIENAQKLATWMDDFAKA